MGFHYLQLEPDTTCLPNVGRQRDEITNTSDGVEPFAVCKSKSGVE